jgi:hypothetical protein
LKFTKQLEIEKNEKRDIKINLERIQVSNKYLSNENEELQQISSTHRKEINKIKLERDEIYRQHLLISDKLKIVEEKLIKNEEYYKD